MNAEQLNHFKTITLDYFGKLTEADDTPALEEAFIQFDGPIQLVPAFASVVKRK